MFTEASASVLLRPRYSLVLNEEHLERSFTYMMKYNGPRVEPCGPPHVILIILDVAQT